MVCDMSLPEAAEPIVASTAQAIDAGFFVHPRWEDKLEPARALTLVHSTRVVPALLHLMLESKRALRWRHVMLHLAQKVAGAPVSGIDGDIGKLEDFYFDETGWNVRYLLVDTGNGKRVLVSPTSVQNGWGRAGVHLNLTRDEVRNGPRVDDLALDPSEDHLDSVKTTSGYHIHARNGEIGHVDDFLIGEESWRIRYLLVDTSNWIGGRSVIVSAEAVERVNKADGTLYVAADRDTIKNAPALESIDAALSQAETGPPFTII
jgi:uncharacterized protein YrrD